MKEEKTAVLMVASGSAGRPDPAEILSPEYDVWKAEGCDAARALLAGRAAPAAVLLDLTPPAGDGEAFLRWLKRSEYACLPVLVLTAPGDTAGEARALDGGAWDFVSKPYRPDVLFSRLRGAVAGSRIYLLEQLKHRADYDESTGLYARSRFFAETRRMLDRNPDKTFVFVCLTINHFRLLRSFGDAAATQRLLQCLADALRKTAGRARPCAYGRMGEETFCLCLPYDKAELPRQLDAVRRQLDRYGGTLLPEPSFGYFVAEDLGLPAETMFGRAAMAAGECRRREAGCVARYDRAMEERMDWEKWALEEMQGALDGRQFAVYVQPRFDLRINRPRGGEALARWEHPLRGLIPPGRFIPTFEKNGLIGKLDAYMWDAVCRLLRNWRDGGLRPEPVSVNISRADLYDPRLPERLTELVTRHKIPPALLNLELTESAFMDDPAAMIRTVGKLRDAGFLVMMDDFGSGYSSLNLLKDIPVDLLKIDMKFLSDEGDRSGRSRRILSAVIRMARGLRLPVTVEGVETREQAEFLRNAGCRYAQGYYFARPMPAAGYEALLRGENAVPP